MAALRREPGHERVYEVADAAVIGTVNLSEVVGILRLRGADETAVRALIEELAFPVVSADEELAWSAGSLRPIADRAGLSLGDRFCLALARRLNATAMTADRSWTAIAAAAGVTVELIR